MNYPPVFQIAAADPGVQAVLGTSPVRFWPFAIAPQKGQPGYAIPYAVHQLIYGNPDNSLSCIPKEDNAGIQIDVYAANATSARSAAAALQSAFESNFIPVTAYNGEFWEPNTGLYRVSLTIETWTERSS